MRLILVGALFALAGCAGKPAAEPEPRIVRVEVPVAVPDKGGGRASLGCCWLDGRRQSGSEGAGAAC